MAPTSANGALNADANGALNGTYQSRLEGHTKKPSVSGNVKIVIMRMQSDVHFNTLEILVKGLVGLHRIILTT